MRTANTPIYRRQRLAGMVHLLAAVFLPSLAVLWVYFAGFREVVPGVLPALLAAVVLLPVSPIIFIRGVQRLRKMQKVTVAGIPVSHLCWWKYSGMPHIDYQQREGWVEIGHRRIQRFTSEETLLVYAIAFGLYWGGVEFLFWDTDLFRHLTGLPRDLALLGLFATLLGVFAAVRTIYRRREPHAPVIGLSVEPIAPGQTFRVALLPSKKTAFERAQIDLVCVEDTFRKRVPLDEDSREKPAKWRRVGLRKEREIYRKTLRENSNAAPPGDAILLQGEGTIPPDAMHSLELDHSGVAWAIEARLRYSGGRERTFTYEFRAL